MGSNGEAPRVNYRDIPKTERKRLAVTAFSVMPRLRNLQFVSVIVPICVASVITNSLAKHDALLTRIGVNVLVALILCAIVQQLFVQPRLKAAIEKLRNS